MNGKISIATGDFLFKYRSHLPLVLFVFAGISIFLSENVFFEHISYLTAIICLSVSIIGIIIRAITVGYINLESYGNKLEAHQLNSLGMYSIMRNPLYLGNFFMWFGLILYVAIPWFVISSVILFSIYYRLIILSEENFLTKTFGGHYLEWKSKTPVFVPNPFKWKSPTGKFSWKKVIRREFYGFTALCISFAYIDFLKNINYFGIYDVQLHWLIFMSAGLLLFFILRLVKKKTKLLTITN